MKPYYGLVLAGCILLSCGCGGSKESASGWDGPGGREALPLPVIPASITDPAERSSYAVLHFWDALAECTPGQLRDTIFMEQSFANFVALLPYVEERDRETAVTALMARLRKDSKTLELMDIIAQKYLDDPNSPMRSEEFYLPFLRCLSSERGGFPEEIRLRAADRLADAMKNRPGSQGADFRMVTRQGRNTSFREALKADTTMVVFYDPDCSRCREIMTYLAENGVEQRYRVLAVDVAGDRGLWDSTKASLPRSWTVAYSTDPVEDRDLYVFPALPSLYLFAPDATVLLKDFTP